MLLLGIAVVAVVHGKVLYRPTSNGGRRAGPNDNGVRQHDAAVALLNHNFYRRLDAVHQVLQGGIEIAATKQLKPFLGIVEIVKGRGGGGGCCCGCC